MLNALTIDLEDWFQGLTSTGRHPDRWPSHQVRLTHNTHLLLDILAQAEVRATFFVLGYAADQHPQLIRQIADAGHEIGLHSYHHQKVSQLTAAQFRADLVRGRQAVEQASGQEVIGYRAPMFSINRSALWALQVLQEMGFRYDSSIFPTRNMLYGFPGAPCFPHHPFENGDFVEFPLSTVELLRVNWPMAGGFYLRALPYPIFKWSLRKLNRQGRPAIIYTHPWELDTDQPIFQVTPRERITHYFGRASLDGKLRRLVRDFQFVPLCQLLDSVSHRAHSI